MKKILIITPGFFPIAVSHGGAVEELINLYLKHNDQTAKYDIVAYSANRKSMVDDNIYKHTDIRALKLFGLKYNLLLFIWKVKRHLFNKNASRVYNDFVKKDLMKRAEKDKYDLIIVVNDVEMIMLVRKIFGESVPIVNYLHNDLLNKDTYAAKRIFDTVNSVWCVSKFIASRVDEINPSVKKTKVIYNTIDFEKFNIDKRSKIEELEKAFSIGANDFVFIYTGRVMPEKGIKELIEAFTMVSDKFKNVKLLIVGGGKKHFADDKYFNMVRKMAKGNDDISVVGHVDRNLLPYYYAISDAQIIPSKWNEPFGLTALEGIVAGIPIIYSGTGGLLEIFDKKELRLKSVDASEIASKMKMLLTSKCLDEFVENSSRVKEKFSQERFFGQLDEEIECACVLGGCNE